MILAWIRGTGGIGTSRFWIYLESKANRICGGAGLGRRVRVLLRTCQVGNVYLTVARVSMLAPGAVTWARVSLELSCTVGS